MRVKAILSANNPCEGKTPAVPTHRRGAAAGMMLLLALLPFTGHGQGTYLPVNEDIDHLIGRYEIKSGTISPQLFSNVRPYYRQDVVAYTDSLDKAGAFTSEVDRFNRDYLRNDSWEWSQAATNDSNRPIANFFYKKKSDLYYVSEPDFDLHVNPVLYVGGGNDSNAPATSYINSRGAEIRGMVDHKFGFYTYFTDNQALLPSYVQDEIVDSLYIVPHEGFWKGFKKYSVDYIQARGYITYDASRHVHLQFGHDVFFLGNGYRSLIRSDYAPPSLFLKATVKIWKLNYVFLLNRMVAEIQGNATGLTANDKYPAKFSAFHHVSLDVGRHLNVGIFEAVIFAPKDSVSTDRFEWSYLNPVIFYRAVEQQFGSSDNVLLGGDFKWNVLPGVSLYGQLVLDEFVLSKIKEGKGWWANKFSIQGGIQYVDAFHVSNLDLQAEVNVIRPYTYSHSSLYGSYSGYRQSLAHPLGANLYEGVGILRYQPLPRLSVVGKLIADRTGRDSNGKDWGQNILKNNRKHVMPEGNTIGQGVRNDILLGTFTASWQLRHNLFIDGNFVYRDSKCALPLYNNKTTLLTVALRWNVARRTFEF